MRCRQSRQMPERPRACGSRRCLTSVPPRASVFRCRRPHYRGWTTQWPPPSPCQSQRIQRIECCCKSWRSSSPGLDSAWDLSPCPRASQPRGAQRRATATTTTPTCPPGGLEAGGGSSPSPRPAYLACASSSSSALHAAGWGGVLAASTARLAEPPQPPTGAHRPDGRARRAAPADGRGPQVRARLFDSVGPLR